MRHYKCKLCGKEMSAIKFSKHLTKDHTIDPKDYYDQCYLSRYYPNGNKCSVCGKDLKWLGFRRFPKCYSTFCSRQCVGTDHMNKYSRLYWQDPELREIFKENTRKMQKHRTKESMRANINRLNKSYSFQCNKALGTALRCDKLRSQEYKYLYICINDVEFKIGITLDNFRAYYKKNGLYHRFDYFIVFKSDKKSISYAEYNLKLLLGEDNLSGDHTEIFNLSVIDQVYQITKSLPIIDYKLGVHRLDRNDRTLKLVEMDDPQHVMMEVKI